MIVFGFYHVGLLLLLLLLEVSQVFQSDFISGFDAKTICFANVPLMTCPIWIVFQHERLRSNSLGDAFPLLVFCQQILSTNCWLAIVQPCIQPQVFLLDLLILFGPFTPVSRV